MRNKTKEVTRVGSHALGRGHEEIFRAPPSNTSLCVDVHRHLYVCFHLSATLSGRRKTGRGSGSSQQQGGATAGSRGHNNNASGVEGGGRAAGVGGAPGTEYVHSSLCNAAVIP